MVDWNSQIELKYSDTNIHRSLAKQFLNMYACILINYVAYFTERGLNWGYFI
jgi:hypothetical protein